MSLRQYYVGQALAAMDMSQVALSSIVSLAKATGRDKAWRKEVIDGIASAVVDVADAVIERMEKGQEHPNEHEKR